MKKHSVKQFLGHWKTKELLKPGERHNSFMYLLQECMKFLVQYLWSSIHRGNKCLLYMSLNLDLKNLFKYNETWKTLITLNWYNNLLYIQNGDYTERLFTKLQTYKPLMLCWSVRVMAGSDKYYVLTPRSRGCRFKIQTTGSFCTDKSIWLSQRWSLGF